MYEAHFGLAQRPFSLSPDTALFVNLADHQQCFSLLVHVLNSGEGFLKVIGEVGTGKTVLCRKLLRYLETQKTGQFHSVYVPNPMLSSVGLYRAVGKELGLTDLQQQDNDALLEHITERILELAESDQSVVIVIDEAQSLPSQTLEALRLISNLETEQKKLVQIILFGQTELDTLLKNDRFRQLRQRITFAHYLQPLNADETQQYIEYRLTRSGYNGPTLFNTKAQTAMYKVSAGIPRMINVLAHKSLMAAFSEKAPQVTKRHVFRAASDSQETDSSTNYNLWLVALSASLLLGAVVWRLL